MNTRRLSLEDAEAIASHLAKNWSEKNRPSSDDSREILLGLGGAWIDPTASFRFELLPDVNVDLLALIVPVKHPSWIMLTRFSVGQEMFVPLASTSTGRRDHASKTTGGVSLTSFVALPGLLMRKLSIGESVAIDVENMGERRRWVSLSLLCRMHARSW